MAAALRCTPSHEGQSGAVLNVRMRSTSATCRHWTAVPPRLQRRECTMWAPYEWPNFGALFWAQQREAWRLKEGRHESPFIASTRATLALRGVPLQAVIQVRTRAGSPILTPSTPDMAHLYDAVQEESEWEVDACVDSSSDVCERCGCASDASVLCGTTRPPALRHTACGLPMRLPPAARYESTHCGVLDAFSGAVMTRWMQFAGCTTPFGAPFVNKDSGDDASCAAAAPAVLLLACDAEPAHAHCSTLYRASQHEADVQLLPGACVLHWPAGTQQCDSDTRTVGVVSLHHTCGPLQKLCFQLVSRHEASVTTGEARLAMQQQLSTTGCDSSCVVCDGSNKVTTTAAATAVIQCSDKSNRVLIVAELTSTHCLQLWRARDCEDGSKCTERPPCGGAVETRSDAPKPAASDPCTATYSSHLLWLPCASCFLSIQACSTEAGSMVRLWRMQLDEDATDRALPPQPNVCAQCVHTDSIAWQPCSVISDPVLPLVWSATPSGALWSGTVVRGDATVHWTLTVAHLDFDFPHTQTATWMLDVTPAPGNSLLAVNSATGVWRVLSICRDEEALPTVTLHAGGSLPHAIARPVQQVRAHAWGWYVLDARGALHALRWPGDALYIVQSALSREYTRLPHATDSAFMLSDARGQRGVVHDFNMLHACCCCTRSVKPRAALGDLNNVAAQPHALVAQPFAAHVPYFVHARVRAHAARVAAAATSA